MRPMRRCAAAAVRRPVCACNRPCKGQAAMFLPASMYTQGCKHIAVHFAHLIVV